MFLETLAGSPWLRPLNDRAAVDDLLAAIRPSWSLTRIRARVVEARRETADARTLVLQPNRLWPGHRAGQHTTVEVEIDGRRFVRAFSISSAPRADGLIEITVKRREGGRVSHWWNDVAAPGDVVTLTEPAGDFVLPAALPRRIVMLSAGSGITPLMAMLRDLGQHSPRCEVLFVHCARSRPDTIFVREIEAIAAAYAWVEMKLHWTLESGHLSADALAKIADGAADALTFACGPDGFMKTVRTAWSRAGLEQRLEFEYFGMPPHSGDADADETVHASRSGTSFVATGGQSLLAAAEAAGLKPQHGCRIGVCHTCKCRKTSGVTVDLRDGRISAEPGEMIQLCVTAARSPVTLEI